MRKFILLLILTPLASGVFAQKDKSDKVETKFLQLPMYDLSEVDPSLLSVTFASGDVEFGTEKIKDTKATCIPSGGGLKDAVEVTTYYYELPYKKPAAYIIARDPSGKIVFADEISSGGESSVDFGYQECKYWVAENMKKDWKKNQESFKESSRKSILDNIEQSAKKRAATNIYPSFYAEKLEVYTAKGKSYNYDELDKAQEMAVKAYEKINKQGPNAESFEKLDAAIAIWKNEIKELDNDDRKARISKNVGKGIYENLAYAYKYTYKFNKSVEAFEKVIELFGNFNNNRTMMIESEIAASFKRLKAAEMNSSILGNMTRLEAIASVAGESEVKLKNLGPAQVLTLAEEYKNYESELRNAEYQAEKDAYEEGVASGEINPYEEYVTETATQGKMLIMNPFLGPNMEELPKEICCIEDLRQLTITGKDISSVPSDISQLTTLTSLNLSNNKIASLPDEIGTLTNLKTLNLSGNPLTEIPEGIKNCSSLKKINLKKTNLSKDKQAALAQLIPDVKIKF
jgi:tetratricopeptide (TPR) repeat protein